MSEIEDEHTNGDVWHLRQPSISRNVSGGDVSSPGNEENERVTQPNQCDSQIDSHDRPGLGFSPREAGSATRPFAMFTTLRDTLSSAFQTSINPSIPNPKLVCRVILLDGRSLHFNLERNALGRELFHRITSYLGLEQDDFFGLTYSLSNSPTDEPEDNQLTAAAVSAVVHETPNPVTEPTPCDPEAPWSAIDAGPSADPITYGRRSASGHRIRTLSQTLRFGDLWKRDPAYVDDVLFWLDLDKRISEQCIGPPYVFHFQVKYFLPHPDRDVYCAEARRHYCLQLRQHLLTGRLPCSFNTHILLGAYISQFVLGDALSQYTNDSNGHSVRSSLSSRRESRALSLSEAHSLGSERACSLAEPESSELDWDMDAENEAVENLMMNEVSWIPREPLDGTNTVVRRKCATLGCTEPERPSVDFGARSVRSESAHSAYLSVLPHLNRRSRSSSFGRPRVGLDDDADDSVSRMGPGFEHGLNNNSSRLSAAAVAEWSDSPGVNWPYPSPTGYYCPEMLRRIARLHRRFRGMPRARAERRFLREAKRLAMYGVELHLIKRVRVEPGFAAGSSALHDLYRSLSNLRRSLLGQDHPDSSTSQTGTWLPKKSFVSHVPGILPFNFAAYPEFAFSLGVCVSGLILCWGQLRVARFPWPRIVDISLQRSNLHLTVRQPDENSRPRLLSYTLMLASSKLATHLFASCVGHHRYFRMGAGRTRVSPPVLRSVQHLSPAPSPTVPESIPVPEPSVPAPTRSTERTRSTRRFQRDRIRQWLMCLIPRTTDSDASTPSRSTRRRRRRPRRDRSALSSRETNTSPPDSGNFEQSRLEATDTFPSSDPPGELWLRRDDPGRAPISNPQSVPEPINRPECVTASSVAAAPVETTPTRSSWMSRAVVSRLNESPIVPTIRRVRSALSGTQRELPGRSTTTQNTTRPVSFSALHKRVVSTCSSRPVPPPRPKQPPTPSNGRLNRLTSSFTMTSSVHDSGKMTPSLMVNLDAIPLVPTYTAIFTPDGMLVQTSRLDSDSPAKSSGGNGLNELSAEELTQLGTGPQQTSTPNHTKRTLIPHSIPLVPTRSVRLTFSSSQMNAYYILDSTPVKTVNGSCIPLVATKSVYLHYS